MMGLVTGTGAVLKVEADCVDIGAGLSVHCIYVGLPEPFPRPALDAVVLCKPPASGFAPSRDFNDG